VGEIADALRRARAEREARDSRSERDVRAEPDASEKPDTPAPAASLAALPGLVGALHGSEAPAAEPYFISPRQTGFWRARALEAARPGAVTERFRHLALRVRRELERRGVHTLLVTSALRQEGKTVTSCNLALALASMAAGRRVVLVDLDLRRPSVARGLGLRPRLGLEAVLRGEAPLEAACHPTSVANLDVLPAVRPVLHAHELLSSPAFGRVVAELSRRYALVVADTPPVLLVPDVPLVTPHFGANLFVVRSGRTSRSNMEEALSLLARETLIGIALNETRLPSHGGQYGYYLGDAEARERDEDEPDEPETLDASGDEERA